VLEGGVDSGFFHVTEETFQPRLLRVKGTFRHVHTRQVPLSFESLCDGDVFVLDLGLKIFQFNGSRSGGFEKIKAAEVVEHLKEKREKHIELSVIEQGEPTDDDEEFWQKIGGRGEIKHDDPSSDTLEKKMTELKLLQLNDRHGDFSFTLVAEGHHNIHPDMFHSDEVYLLDKGCEVYIYVGKNANPEEKHRGVVWAQKYIVDIHGGLPLPISVVPESGDPNSLTNIIRN